MGLFGTKSGRVYGARPYADRMRDKALRVAPQRTVWPGAAGATGYTGATGHTGASGVNPAQAMNPMQALTTQYEDAWNQAKSANENRYNDILQRWEGLRGGVLADLDNSTAQQSADLQSQYAKRGANIAQSLHSQGLAGTTIAPTMQMGVDRNLAEASRRLGESKMEQRAGYNTNITGNMLNFMRDRTDAYPDMNQFEGLMGQFGNAMGGGRRSYGGGHPSGGRTAAPTLGGVNGPVAKPERTWGMTKETRSERIKRQNAEKAARGKAQADRMSRGGRKYNKGGPNTPSKGGPNTPSMDSRSVRQILGGRGRLQWGATGTDKITLRK